MTMPIKQITGKKITVKVYKLNDQPGYRLLVYLNSTKKELYDRIFGSLRKVNEYIEDLVFD
jgi:hypothetical protein